MFKKTLEWIANSEGTLNIGSLGTNFNFPPSSSELLRARLTPQLVV